MQARLEAAATLKKVAYQYNKGSLKEGFRKRKATGAVGVAERVTTALENLQNPTTALVN